VLRARGHTVPAFVLRASRSDLEVLITARQFARDAAGFEAQFTGHGMGSAVIAATTDAFEQAMSDRGGVGGASEAASSTAPADSPERQAGRPWPPPRPWFRQLVAGRSSL
jgi:hypothetical protein